MTAIPPLAIYPHIYAYLSQRLPHETKARIGTVALAMAQAGLANVDALGRVVITDYSLLPPLDPNVTLTTASEADVRRKLEGKVKLPSELNAALGNPTPPPERDPETGKYAPPPPPFAPKSHDEVASMNDDEKIAYSDAYNDYLKAMGIE